MRSPTRCARSSGSRGARRSYLENCESMQRIHISPRIGSLPITDIRASHIEGIANAMLGDGRRRKPSATSLSFLFSIFEYAIDRGLVRENPVRRATRPGRRRRGDVNPDLQFLTVEELDAVLRAIPDEVVVRAPAPTRRGRPGPGAAAATRRARTGAARRDPRRRDDRAAPVRASRPSLARRRLERAADPRPKHVRARRALRRRQVRPLDPSLGADGRAGSHANSTAGRDARVYAATTTSSSPIRRPAIRSTARR